MGIKYLKYLIYFNEHYYILITNCKKYISKFKHL